jgi:predicted regulator of Ras-like GTPase activity (Roadblock/LC7/MglB family)
MSINQILKNVVDNVQGGLGAIVMGYDGISIDEYLKDEVDIDVPLVAVEYSAVLKEVNKTLSILKIGKMEEVSISTDFLRILVRAINDDLFVVLAIITDGNYGKGRYLLKLHTPELRECLE